MEGPKVNSSSCVRTLQRDNETYICLSDLAKRSNQQGETYLIQCWMSLKNTVEYLAFWERLNNTGFNDHGFEAIWKKAGLNSFVLTPEAWIRETNAIGIISVDKRIYAHSDIAFKFACWLSVDFELFIYREITRLQALESPIEDAKLALHENTLVKAIQNYIRKNNC